MLFAGIKAGAMRKTLSLLLTTALSLTWTDAHRAVAQPPAEPPLKVLHADSFSKDTLEEYSSGGDASWVDGQLRLPAGAYARRELAAERHMSVTLDIDWLDEPQHINQNRTSWITCGYGLRNGSTLLLRLVRNRQWLAVKEGLGDAGLEGLLSDNFSLYVSRNVFEKPDDAEEGKWVRQRIGSYDFDSKGTGPWTFTLRHGLVELSDGQQIVVRRYLSSAESDVRQFVIWSEKASTAVDDLRVTGVPLPKHSVLQQQSVKRRNELASQLTQLTRQKQYAKAIPLRRESLTLAELNYGPDNYRVASELQSLSLLYYRVGDKENDLQTSQRRLDTCQRVYGDDHPRTANALSDLAYTWNKAGEFRSEEAALRRAADIRRQTIGKDDEKLRPILRRLQTALSNVARLAERDDDFETARQRLVEVLEFATEENGRHHWSTVSARVSLNDLIRRQNLSGEQRHQLRWAEQAEADAKQYSSEKKYDQAIAARERALDVRKSLLGEHHYDYARSLTLLSVLYSRKRQYARGELLSRKSLEIHSALFGDDHPDVAVAHQNLGYFYSQLQDHQRAVESRRNAVDAYRRLYGDEDKRFIENRDDLAKSLAAYREELIRSGRFGDARQVVNELVTIDEQRFEDNAWRLFDSRWQRSRIDQWERLTPEQRRELAEALSVADQYENQAGRNSDQAIEQLQKLITLTAELFGAGSREHRNRLARLAVALRLRDRSEEAISILQEVAAYDTALFADIDGRHPNRAHAVNELGLVKEQIDQPEAAIDLFREAFDLYLTTEGADSRNATNASANCQRVLGQLATEAERAGQFEQAESLIRELRERAIGTFGETDWRSQDAALRLKLVRRLREAEPETQNNYAAAATLFHKGRDQRGDELSYEEAVATLTESLTGIRAVLGDDHWVCASVLMTLGDALDATGDTTAALQQYTDAYRIRTSLLSPDHLDVADIGERLGLLLASQQQADKARPILEQVLAIRKKFYGDQDALVTWTQARLEELDRAIADMDDTAWPHTFVVYQLANTAKRLRSEADELTRAGDFAGAIDRQRRLAVVERRRLGPGHPDVAEILSSIATSQKTSGDLTAAISAARQAVQHCQTAFGDQHWRTRGARLRLKELERFAALSSDDQQRLRDTNVAAEAAAADRQTPRSSHEPAITSLRKAIAIRNEVLGEPDTRTLALQLELVRYQSEQSTATYEAIEAGFREVLREREKLYGVGHPAVSEVQSAIAKWKQSRGELSVAHDLFQQVVSRTRAAYGEESLETASALFDLAGFLLESGQLEQAEEVSRRSAELRNARLDPFNPVMAQAFGQLADVRLAREMPDGAFGVANRAVEIWREQPGDTVGKAIALGTLGIVLAKQSEHEKAGPLLNDSLEMFQRLKATDRTDAVRPSWGLGVHHYKSGDLDTAQNFLRDARRHTRELPTSHWLRRQVATDLYSVVDQIAGKHRAGNRLDETESSLRELLPILEESYDAANWRIRAVHVELEEIARKRTLNEDQLARLINPDEAIQHATELLKSGDQRAGLAYAERVLADYRELLGADSRSSALMMFGLAAMKSGTGKYDESQPLYDESLATIARVTGREDPQFATMLLTLGELYQQSDQLPRAIATIREALQAWKRIPETDAATIATTQQSLASALVAHARVAESEGNLETASRDAREAAQLLTIALGPQHWRTTDANRQVAELQELLGFDEAAREKLARADEAKKQMAALRSANRVSDALTPASERLELLSEVFGAAHLRVAEHRQETGRLYYDMQDWTKARQCFNDASRMFKLQLGAEHPLRATCLTLASLAELRLSGPEAARPLAEEALAIRRQHLGPDHFDTLSALNNLALVQDEAGDLTAAQASYEKVIATRTRLLGPHAASLATPLMNFGLLQSRQGNYAEALSLLQRSLRLHREYDGDDDPDTTLCMRQLAGIYRHIEDFDSATDLLQQAFETEQRVLGTSHTQTATTQRELGRAQLEADRFELARGNLEGSLASFEKLYGENSVQAAYGHAWLSNLERSSGNIQKAKELARKSIDIHREAVGSKHTDTADLIASLARNHKAASEFDEARKHYLSALSIDRQVWPVGHPRIVERLSQVGRNLETMGFHSEARDIYEEALTITRETHPGDSRELADVLGEFGLALYQMGDYQTAREHLEESLAINRRVRGDADRNVSLVCQRLALALDIVGDRKGYVRYSREALTVAERVWGSDHRQIVVYLNNLAAGFDQDAPERTQLLERGLRILESPPREAKARLEIAQQLNLLDRYDEALQLYATELEERRKANGDSGRHVAWVLRRMAEVHREREDHAQARDLFGEAQKLLDGDYGPDKVASADNRIDLALEHLRLKEADRGLSLLETGLESLKAEWGSDAPRLARRLTDTALTLLELGYPDPAVRYARESLRINEKNLDPQHADVAKSRVTLGQAFGNQGDYKQAWKHMLIGAQTMARRVAQGLAGESEQQHSQLVGFERKVLEGLFSLAEAVPETAAASAEDLLSVVLDWKSMSGRALLARQEALMLERDPQAIRLYDELRGVRRQLTQLKLQAASAGSGSQIQTLTARSQELERQLASQVKDYSTLRSSAEAGPDSIARHMPPNSVLVEFTRYNQYHFADSNLEKWGAARYAAIIYQPLSRKTWMTDFERAEAESRRLGKPLVVHFVADWDPYTKKMDAEVVYEPEFQQMMDQFVAVRVNLGRFDKNIDLGKRFNIKGVPTDILISPDGKELGRVQGARSKEQYIEGIRRAFKVSPQGGGPRIVLLGDAKPIEDAIYKWRRSVDTRRVDRKAEHRLHELIWTPIEQSLFRDASRLFIAPDGELALIPFEAIRLADDRYLIEKYHVSYLSNGRELMPRLAPPGRPGPAVVVSDPAYDLQEPGSSQPPDTLLAATDQTRSEAVTTRGITFRSLPGFAREARAVAEAWKKSGSSESLTLIEGPDAVEERLFQLKRPQFLHLVTHGFYFSDLETLRSGSPIGFSSPVVGSDDRGLSKVRPTRTTRQQSRTEDGRLRSGLALAGANRWRQRSSAGHSDGLLTAMEVENLNLWGTELVVLSACETGLGEVQVGEGVMGLRRAFQQAGARTVMSSLWKVPDAETEQLMSRFFELWLAGGGKSAALRTAQLELIERLRSSSSSHRSQSPPFYWAAFVCHGAP